METSKKTVLVTGATTGIGKSGALELGRRGWRVFVHARSTERGQPIVQELQNAAPNADFTLVTGNFASLADVKGLARQVKALTQTLDVLWNNAGLIIDQRKKSEDGFELTMAINHIAPFVLTRELLPLIEPVHGCIITTSSGAYMSGRFNWNDWLDEESAYTSFKAYSKSKLANILFTRELARRAQYAGVIAHCYHPGFVSTDFGKPRIAGEKNSFNLPGWFRSWLMLTPEAGADTAVFLAEDPFARESNGQFWIKRKVRRTNRHVNDANALKLWELSEQVTK